MMKHNNCFYKIGAIVKAVTEKQDFKYWDALQQEWISMCLERIRNNKDVAILIYLIIGAVFLHIEKIGSDQILMEDEYIFLIKRT